MINIKGNYLLNCVAFYDLLVKINYVVIISLFSNSINIKSLGWWFRQFIESIKFEINYFFNQIIV